VIAWLPLMLLGCPAEPPTAVDYCETTADMFCEYYLRCGRIAEETPIECRRTFIETCNGVYEPRYAALEAQGLLALSAEGIEACAEHLSDVECDQQIFDLDGSCADIWQGLSPQGGACSFGIESFVCEPGTECVLGLDFCGTCEVREATDRAQPGDSCDEDTPCRLGANCIDAVCAGPTIVEVGDNCDALRDCPYRSECIGGTCVLSPLLGEACDGGVACASGWCDVDVCAPLVLDGASCDSGVECVSGSCPDGTCAEQPGVCFE